MVYQSWWLVLERFQKLSHIRRFFVACSFFRKCRNIIDEFQRVLGCERHESMISIPTKTYCVYCIAPKRWPPNISPAPKNQIAREQVGEGWNSRKSKPKKVRNAMSTQVKESRRYCDPITRKMETNTGFFFFVSFSFVCFFAYIFSEKSRRNDGVWLPCAVWFAAPLRVSGPKVNKSRWVRIGVLRRCVLCSQNL